MERSEENYGPNSPDSVVSLDQKLDTDENPLQMVRSSIDYSRKRASR